MRDIYVRIEVKLSGAGGPWTDITRDVHDESGIQGTRGIRGSGPLARLADIGVLTLWLINHPGNSGGLDGYYSPGHANLRAGFDLGIAIRAVLIVGPLFVEEGFVEEGFVESGSPRVIWTGTITKIEPESGRYMIPRLTRIEARDYMEVLARERYSPAVQVGISDSEAARSVIDAVSLQPTALEIGQGPDTYDYYGDLEREESSVPMAALQRICQSSYGTAFVRGDGTFVYEPRNEKRAVFGSPLTAAEALTEADIRNSDPLVVSDNRQSLTNKIQTIFTPRLVDPATNSVLYRLTEAIPFLPGNTELRALYTDPDERGLRAGGMSMIQPQANTDYKFNSERDGSGTDETANVSIAATFRGNAVTLTVTNSAAITVYPVDTSGNVLLTARGVAIIAKERIYFEEEDAASIAKIGENALVYDMPYQSDVPVAKAFATWLRDTLVEEERKLERVSVLLAIDNIARARELIALDISDIVTVAETMTALAGTEKFFINAIDFRTADDGLVWLDFTLTPANAGPFVEFGADHLTTSGSHANQSSYVTAPVSAPANELLLAWVSSKHGSATNPNAATATGLGGTWVEVATIVFDAAGNDRRRLTLLRTMLSTPATGSITFAFGGQTQDRCSWSVVKRGDVDTGGTNGSAAVVQSATASGNNVGSITATLAAFGSVNNWPFLGVALKVSDTIAPESGWELIGRRTVFTSMMTAWKDGVDTTATATIPSATGNVGAIAVEVKAA